MNINNNPKPNEQQWKLLVSLIKEAAAAKAIKPYHIAEQCKISPSTVKRVFDFEFCPKLDIFIAMANAVGMNFFIEDWSYSKRLGRKVR
jgi:AraC-like DNA-binding protein